MLKYAINFYSRVILLVWMIFAVNSPLPDILRRIVVISYIILKFQKQKFTFIYIHYILYHCAFFVVIIVVKICYLHPSFPSIFQSHKMAWPFLEPVDELEVSDYYEIVKEPMGRFTAYYNKLIQRFQVIIIEYFKFFAWFVALQE